MFEHEILRTEEPRITPIPRLAIRKVMAFLIVNKIPYEVLKEEDIPDRVPGIITFLGKRCSMGLWALKCSVESECLHDIAESIHHVSVRDIVGEEIELDKFLIRETGEPRYLTAKYSPENETRIIDENGKE